MIEESVFYLKGKHKKYFLITGEKLKAKFKASAPYAKNAFALPSSLRGSALRGSAATVFTRPVSRRLSALQYPSHDRTGRQRG